MGPVRMLSFLMLIFSLCDADSTCTTELKALTLDPPEIIAEYGGNPVIVNCSTTSDDHYGIYWRVGNESSDIGEDFFIIHSVPLSEWDVKAECKVMPSESRECSKDLKVIVYKNPEVVLSAQRVNVMGEETQYRLQCDIINVAPVQHLTVSWYKNNESIKTQSFNDTTKTPVNESSVLRVNISREENEVQFRCEAQLDFGPDVPQLPVISQTHSVSAHYAPELNTKNNPHDISTLEGTNITLSCEAEGNPPPVYHWTCDGVNQLENTNSLSITRVNHNVTCTCTATNYLGNITKTIHVHVKERGCPLTLTPSEIVVRFGDPVSINCSTSATYVVGMGWEAPFGGTGFEPPPAVTWRVEKVEEWTPSPFCYATLDDNSQCSMSPVIIVYKSPDIVSISSLDQSEMTEDHVYRLDYNKHARTQYRLQCDIINVAPVQHLTVSWYKNNESIMTQSFNDTTKTPVNESSVLRVNISREENEVQFRCEAHLDFGSYGPQLLVISQTHNVSVDYAPELNTINNPHDISTLEGTNITLSCEAEGNPPPVYHWTCDGVNQLENTNSLSITRVNHNVTCTCTATNDLGNITKTIHVHVKERGCPLTLTPSEIVVRFGDPVSINCSTSATYVVGMGWEAPFGGTGFEPPPAVTWRVKKVEEWTPSPSCSATLDDNSQCFVRPVINVYKGPDTLSISELDHSLIMEATAYKQYTRTQHRLKCDIINVAPVQHLTVSWYKNNESIMTQSFNDTTTTPVNESSVLRVTISREENEVQFRCEAQLDFGPDGPQLPVIFQTYSISAHYAPELNTKNNPHDISTLEGTNITLSCEAEGNPPPVYHWTCDGVNQLENTNSLSITRVNHNVTCTCTATNDLGNITKTIHVHVKERGCPLTLTPSEIVVRFGDPVSINCSTSTTYVVGMGWEAPFGGTGFEPPPAVTWSTEKVEEWTPSPSCYATLDDNSQCFVRPVITVYKGPDTVSIPELDHSLIVEARAYKQYTRTQHRLQCDIINVAPVQHLTVNWYKNNESIMTQSFNDTTKTPVNESSVLRVTISREENEVQLRCEAQLDFGSYGPKLPVIFQTYSISAHYAPELNTKNNPHDISTLEGTNITLSCEAEGNPPPVYHWTCDGVNQLENTNSLSITRVNHNVTCTCTATNDLGNITKTIHVHVKERGCPLTLTPSEIVVRFGDPVSINCSTSATYVVGMGWEAPFGGTGFEPPPAVTWRVKKVEEWTPSPSCYATLDDNSQCSMSPVITVYKPPDSVSVSAVDHSSILEGREYHLKCDINNVAPVQNLSVKWYKGKETAFTQKFDEFRVTPVNKSSSLRFTAQRDHNGSVFRCEAELQLGPKGPELSPSLISAPYTVVVLYAPEFKEGNDSKEVLLGENVTLSCSADGNPPAIIEWIYAAAGNSKETTEGRQRTVTITRATFINAGVYICVGENKFGRKARSVTLVVKGKTSYIPFPAIWVSLAVLLIILFLLVCLCHKRRNARGHYSFVPVRGPDIPLTTAQANGKA